MVAASDPSAHHQPAVAKILIIDDDMELAANLVDWFSMEGHVAESVHTGEDGLQMLGAYEYDVILLDWNLPGISGLEVCRQYRKAGGSSIVIFLTGLGEITNKEQGLDAGGDDYQVKPFNIRELSARVRSVLRRAHGPIVMELRIGDVLLEPDSRTVKVGEVPVHLMPKESALLEYLMRHPNRAFNTQALLNAVWPSDSGVSPETVRTFMKTLRQKLSSAGRDELIKTVPGAGYVIESKSS